MFSAGILAALGFPPVANIVPLLVSVVIVILVLRRNSRTGRLLRLDAALGLTYGFAFFGTLLWWMNIIGHEAYVVVVAAESLFFSAAFVCLRLVLRFRLWPWWTSLVWVAFEYLRGTVPFGGLPWGRLAYATVDTPFESYARLVGLPLTSGVVFFAGALVAMSLRNPRRAWHPAAALAVLVGAGIALPTGVADGGVEKRVALVQGDVPVLFEPWPRGEILVKHLMETSDLARAIRSGVLPQPDLVLWPENSTDIDPLSDATTRQSIQRAVIDVGAPILVGAIIDGPTPQSAYNVGIAWSESGPSGMYTKQKLVPFGEYVPFRGALGGLSSRLDREVPRDMIPGDAPGIMEVAGITLGDMICWDVAQDQIVRQTVESGAEALVVQTSNASFTGTAQPSQQWQISRLRAIQSARSVLVPSTNGITGVIDAQGNEVARAPTRTPATVSATIELGRGLTWGVRVGDRAQAPVAALAFLATAVAIAHRRRSGLHPRRR
jgi:apolipoprotein N-acyltransferase